MIEKLREIVITKTKVGLKRMAGLALRASGRPKMGRTSANSQFKRRCLVRPYGPGRRTGTSASAPLGRGAPAHGARPQTLAGLLLWARATS